MGAPNILDALHDNQAAIDAVNKACNSTFETLANDTKKGKDYINQNSKGIVQTLGNNSLWYSKFSEDFNLDALDKIIDDTVAIVVDAIKLNAGSDDPELAAQSAKDVGSLVQGVLGLAASSSTTEENLQVTFSYIVSGENNFAVYYAYNSAIVAAQNVWGNKDITVIANTYVVALVSPNPAITRAQMLQKDLNTLKKLNDAYDDALVAAKSQQEVDNLTFRQNAIDQLEDKIRKEIVKEKRKTLVNVLGMEMNDWVVVSSVDPDDPTPNGIWVYKTNPNFPGIHFSFSVDDPPNTHVGTDASPKSYYYGMTINGLKPHFAGAKPTDDIKQMLLRAWKDYYTVRQP
jgi:hypothetical protein